MVCSSVTRPRQIAHSDSMVRCLRLDYSHICLVLLIQTLCLIIQWVLFLPDCGSVYALVDLCICEVSVIRHCQLW